MSADRWITPAIEAEASALSRTVCGHAIDPRVFEAMARVPRHRFVPPDLFAHAYDNEPQPIGWDQTISQPSLVAFMTSELATRPSDVVLEIGSGCGYQTAILAELVAEVISIEIVPSLALSARGRLASLGYRNVSVHEGDGSRGAPWRAPFGGVIVTASAPRLPSVLIEQLAIGRRMIVPVERELRCVTRTATGYQERALCSVLFVPLTGEAREARGA
jgi:protein-L-isoaspartate(D-aspartate) O-methyltransferase